MPKGGMPNGPNAENSTKRMLCSAELVTSKNLQLLVISEKSN